MELHHQAVVETHARHLGEHLRAEKLRICGVLRAGLDLRTRLRVLQNTRSKSFVASIASRSAVAAVGWP